MNFTHIDEKGNAFMVDVSEKKETSRVAVARGEIRVNEEVLSAVLNNQVKKGDVLTVAQTAGILGIKKTSDLIPMCHPLMLTNAKIVFKINESENIIIAECIAKTNGKTGVEMEALTGVSVALLTIYDMCKAIDKRMIIENIKLCEKSGGKSGHFINE